MKHLLFFIFLTVLQFGYAGNLIVTYQTELNGERLDRVRFILTDANKLQRMYPQGTAFVDDAAQRSRMVLIDHLTPGNYSIEFVVPNRDNLFEEIPVRHFAVDSENTVKINQMIKTRSQLPQKSSEQTIEGE